MITLMPKCERCGGPPPIEVEWVRCRPCMEATGLLMPRSVAQASMMLIARMEGRTPTTEAPRPIGGTTEGSEQTATGRESGE